MVTFRLVTPAYPNPLWLNQYTGGTHEAVVDESGGVVLGGVRLAFKADTLPAGTAVQVWLGINGFFVCAERSEVERDRAEREAKELERQQAARDKRNRLRDAALAANASLAVPVKWDVAIKDNLSGLGESSWGDGRKKNTVHHILLLEPLLDGKFRRAAGDFLCTAQTGSNGKQWSGQSVERHIDGDGASYQPEVTCKACLARAARWKAAPATSAPDAETVPLVDMHGAPIKAGDLLSWDYGDPFYQKSGIADWMRQPVFVVTEQKNGKGLCAVGINKDLFLHSFRFKYCERKDK